MKLKMKKILGVFVSFIMIGAISSCGGNNTVASNNVDSTLVDSIEEVVDSIDSVVVDSTICND